jgi:enoyl-CoA hydratase/carnithine racemase
MWTTKRIEMPNISFQEWWCARELVSADRVAAWNAANQVVADEDLYREAHAFATRLSRLGGIDVHRTISGNSQER